MFINVKINFIQHYIQFSHLHYYSPLTVRFTKHMRLLLNLQVFLKIKISKHITDSLIN